MQKKVTVLVTILVLNVSTSFSQKTLKDATEKKYFIGSTLFMLANLNTKDLNSPDFYQINFGYRITAKDAVSIETKTWKYAWPLGIPYGKDFEASEEKFPGYIREYGIALAYQRFWWKGLFTAIHIMNAKQTFIDNDGDKIKNGYQMFNSYRLGYHFKFFKNNIFIEPSLAVTHRPFQSKMPESFEQLNNKWSKFFIGEPGLHFGINF